MSKRSRKKGRRKQARAAAPAAARRVEKKPPASEAKVRSSKPPAAAESKQSPKSPAAAEKKQSPKSPAAAANKQSSKSPAAGPESADRPVRAKRVKVRTRRGRAIQIVRRSVLALTLLSIFVLPLAALARVEADWGGAFAVGASGPGAGLARTLPQLAPLADVLSGSIWSMTIGGFAIADPLAALLATTAGRTTALLLAALVPIALTLLLGRVFCGWLCPARLPVELAAWTRRHRRRRKHLLRAPWLRRFKYGVLVAGLILAVLLGWNLLALIYPPAILVREGHYLLTYGTLGWGAALLAVVLVGDLLVDGGIWCRGLCPGGALYSLLARPALLRMQLDEERCTGCNRCQKVCPLGLDPTDSPGGECDRCGLCRRECRDSALDLRFALPGRRDGRS